MNWRRGLLLAGIHFAIAVPLVLWEEAWVWPHLRAQTALVSQVHLERAVWQEGEQAVTFDPGPCEMWTHNPDVEEILSAAEMPARVLSGWGNSCHPSWSVAGLIGAHRWINTRSQERKVAGAFLVLIPLQWFFLGASRRVRPRRWYAEPGALITACLVIAAVPFCVAPILWAVHSVEFPRLPEGLGILARLPILVMIPAWFLWLGFFVWKCLEFAWRKIRRPYSVPSTVGP